MRQDTTPHEFLAFIENFIRNVRLQVKFLRPQDIELVLDMIERRYHLWLDLRGRVTPTDTGEVIVLHRDEEEENQ